MCSESDVVFSFFGCLAISGEGEVGCALARTAIWICRD